MASTLAIANLRPAVTAAPVGGGFLALLLRLEAWLDRRASGRALYRMDQRGLADLALSGADVERINTSVEARFRR